MRCRDFCRDCVSPEVRFTGIRSICPPSHPQVVGVFSQGADDGLAHASHQHTVHLRARAAPPSRPRFGPRTPSSDGRGKSSWVRAGPTVRGNADREEKSRRRPRERYPMPWGRATAGRGKWPTAKPRRHRNLPRPRFSLDRSPKNPQTTAPSLSSRSSAVVIPRISGVSTQPAVSVGTPHRELRLLRLALQPSIARQPALCPA